MMKKKVLFLINDLSMGGAEKVLVNLVNNLNKNKFDLTLRTLVNQGENRENLSAEVKYEYIFQKPFRGLNYLHLLPKNWIYKKVAYGDFDIIVVYLHGVLTRIVSYAPSSQKTVAYLHANMERSPFISGFKSKKELENCFLTYDAIVSVSQSVEDSFKKVSGISERLHVIYNTFDDEKIRLLSKEPLKINRGEGVVKLCAVGSLTSVKGFDRLINVLGKLKDDNLKFHLTIVGEGEERTSLETCIRENELQEDVSLAGFQKNPYKYIANSDWLISSSFSEGFSSVVVESVILGVPVLTTNTSGMKEILGENNEYGKIVENDEDSLYHGISEILSNPGLHSHYHKKLMERASQFSMEHSVKEVENLLNGIISPSCSKVE